MLKEVNEMATHRDPVCGMKVEEEGAVGSSEYEGRTYYFCSEGCKSKFDAEPGRYADGEGQGGTE